MVSPLLLRGLASGKTSTVRQSAVIIENMSKLVDDPMDAAPFLPKLLPALTKAADILSDPEARGVAERAVAQLERLEREVAEALTRQQHIEHSRVLDALNKKYKFKQGLESYVDHVAWLCCSLMSIRKFDLESWKEISDHLALVTKVLYISLRSLLTLSLNSKINLKQCANLCLKRTTMTMMLSNCVIVLSPLPTVQKFCCTTLSLNSREVQSTVYWAETIVVKQLS